MTAFCFRLHVLVIGELPAVVGVDRSTMHLMRRPRCFHVGDILTDEQSLLKGEWLGPFFNEKMQRLPTANEPMARRQGRIAGRPDLQPVGTRNPGENRRVQRRTAPSDHTRLPSGGPKPAVAQGPAIGLRTLIPYNAGKPGKCGHMGSPC